MKQATWFLLILLSLCRQCTSEEEKSSSKDEKDSQDDGVSRHYLYLPLGSDAEPVIDYRPTPDEDADEPDFIFGLNNGPRVVEFYAPWCPHCQHFREHYIEFAEQLQKLAQQQPEKADVKIYAVSCSAYRPLCQKFGITSYPGLRLFKAGATNATGIAKYWQLHPFDVMKDLGLLTAELNLELPAIKKKRKSLETNKNVGVDSASGVRTKQNVFDDAWLSLDYALKNGVFMNDSGPLNNETQTRLKDWIHLLHSALPPSWTLQKMIKALMDNFSDIVQSEQELIRVLRQYPPPRKKWSQSCTHGDPVAGYTCGLWELFHLVTVGAVEYNSMISNDDGGLVIHTEEAALKIRNFVESFFGCEVCRINFVNAFDRCSFNRCTRLSHESYSDTEWIQLPVWLWETHNAVNVRLLHEKGQRENWEPQLKDEQERRWPSRKACPKCWDESGGWDDETIYKYLRLEYWPEDDLADKYRTELLLNEIQVDETKIEPGGSHAFSPIWILLLFFCVGGSAGWYAKRHQRWLSGRHKKTDESYPANGSHQGHSLV